MELSVRFLLQSLTLAVLFTFEGVFPLFKERKQRIRHALPNLFTALLNAFLVSFFLAAITLKVISFGEEHSIGLAHLFGLPEAVEFILLFLLFDLWMYLWHVANHRISFLWKFHRTHHADTEMDVTTALRFHPGEIFFSTILRWGVILLLGMSYQNLFIYELCLQPVILLHHSNVAIPEKYDRLLRHWIVTPNMHRVHHSLLRAETDSNYSSIFSFWDRIAKSFRERTDVLAIQYGLENFREAKYQSLVGILKIPFTRDNKGSAS